MTENTNIETLEVSEADVVAEVEQEFGGNPESTQSQTDAGGEQQPQSEDPKSEEVKAPEDKTEGGQAEQTAQESGDDGTPKGVKKLLSQRNELRTELEQKNSELTSSKEKIAALEKTISELQQQEITDPEEAKERDQKVSDAKARKVVHEENLEIVSQKAISTLAESTSDPEKATQKIKETMDKYPGLDPFDAFNMLVGSGEVTRQETDPQEINKSKSNDILGKAGVSMQGSSFDSMSTDEMGKQLQKEIDSGNLQL